MFKRMKNLKKIYQQHDGNFFEKFGSLRRDTSKDGEEMEKERAAQAALIIIVDSIGEECLEGNENGKNDLNSDSEIQYNIDELYSKIIYEIIHNIEFDCSEITKSEIFVYLQKTFKMDIKKHKELLEIAAKKEPPKTPEVIEAEHVVLAKWSVYTGVHQNHPLNFSVFLLLLDKLVKLKSFDIKIFWDPTIKLLPSLFSLIRGIRKKIADDEKVALKQLIDALKILAKLSKIPTPQGMNLFPTKQYAWRKNVGEADLRSVLTEAVICGANNWFNHILKPEIGIEKLQHLIKIVQLVRTDLKNAIELYNTIFQENIQFLYANTLYNVYQEHLTKLIEPDVIKISKYLRKLSYVGFTPSEEDSEEVVTIGTSLFELYLALQKFVILGTELCPNEIDSFEISNFHCWFIQAMTQWLEIAVFKAERRIEKAVKLDSLEPVNDTAKYSSSAVDTRTIFYQVKEFWTNLNWPDIESSYVFIAKIIDDNCKCCVFYADKMAARVDEICKSVDENKFEVTKEWCLAINNIDKIGRSLTPFTEELGMDEIIQKLSKIMSPLEAERCKLTLDNVIQNSIDTVDDKIIELLEVICSKMRPSMKRLLVEGAELAQKDNNSIDRVMMYVDNNLATLHDELNEDNFNKTLAFFWDNLSSILKDLLQANLKKSRPPSFFANLHETLKIMVKSFKKSDDNFCPQLVRIEHLLKLNGLETLDLIHQVHLDLYKEQLFVNDSPLGQLTVQVKFNENDLQVHVMNGRNLIRRNSNGASNSFVKIHLLPKEKFISVIKPKTQTHYENMFPLYDEKFDIVLTPEHHNIKDALILFSVKDYKLGYNNQHIGESFVHFKNIERTSAPIESLPQLTLELTRPTTLATAAIEVLEYRQRDKLAKEFLKKIKQKMGATN